MGLAYCQGCPLQGRPVRGHPVTKSHGMGWRSKGACKASRSPSRQTIGSFIENLADMPRHILTDIRSAGQAAAEEGGIRTDLRRSANPEVGATLGHPDSCLAVTAKADTASGETQGRAQVRKGQCSTFGLKCRRRVLWGKEPGGQHPRDTGRCSSLRVEQNEGPARAGRAVSWRVIRSIGVTNQVWGIIPSPEVSKSLT